MGIGLRPPPILQNHFPVRRLVGWVERSDTHHKSTKARKHANTKYAMGIGLDGLNPSYALR